MNNQLNNVAEKLEETIDNILLLTEKAYSRPDFTEEGWKDVSLFLLNEGFNKKEVIEIMLSKHMRWACDYYSRKKGENDVSTIKKYMKKNPNVFVEFLQSLDFV